VCRELARLAGPDHGDRSADWIRAVAAPALARVEASMSSSEDRHEQLLETRGVLFHLAGADGHDPGVLARARQLLDDTSADASLRAAATSVVAASATPEEHAQLEQRWRSAGTPQDELRFLNALVDAADPALFAHALELAATEVRTQNAPYLLRRAIDHPTLGAEAWALVAQRWDELAERFPSNSLPRMLEGIRGLTDSELAGSVESFLHDHPTPSGERQVHQHLERMWVTVGSAERVRAELDGSPGMLMYAQD
jgi:puromycin-sensitive aminopeptidase